MFVFNSVINTNNNASFKIQCCLRVYSIQSRVLLLLQRPVETRALW